MYFIIIIIIINLYWSIVDLQYWLTFCCTTKQISRAHIYIHSFLDSFPKLVIMEY